MDTARGTVYVHTGGGVFDSSSGSSSDEDRDADSDNDRTTGPGSYMGAASCSLQAAATVTTATAAAPSQSKDVSDAHWRQVGSRTVCYFHVSDSVNQVSSQINESHTT